nr:MAG TPA: hypothetical protein [Caudoviricetes sp.]
MQNSLSNETVLLGPKDRTELFAKLAELRASKGVTVPKPSLTNASSQAEALVASLYPPRRERLSDTSYREYYV